MRNVIVGLIFSFFFGFFCHTKELGKHAQACMEILAVFELWGMFDKHGQHSIHQFINYCWDRNQYLGAVALTLQVAELYSIVELVTNLILAREFMYYIA